MSKIEKYSVMKMRVRYHSGEEETIKMPIKKTFDDYNTLLLRLYVKKSVSHNFNTCLCLYTNKDKFSYIITGPFKFIIAEFQDEEAAEVALYAIRYLPPEQWARAARFVKRVYPLVADFDNWYTKVEIMRYYLSRLLNDSRIVGL